MSERKSANAYRTISEVAESLGVPQHVLRFWETKFPAVKPLKRGGNRRYYRPEDIELLQLIHRLLHVDGYTIKGAQKLLKERGARALAEELLGGKAAEAGAPDVAEAEAEAEVEAVLAEAGIPEALTVDPDAVEKVAAPVAAAAPVEPEGGMGEASPAEASPAEILPVEAEAAEAPLSASVREAAQAALVAELRSIRARLAGALGEAVPAVR